MAGRGGMGYLLLYDTPTSDVTLLSISLWEGCQNFGILLLKIERVLLSRHNLRTHHYDTKYLNHIEKAETLSFPTV